MDPDIAPPSTGRARSHGRGTAPAARTGLAPGGRRGRRAQPAARDAPEPTGAAAVLIRAAELGACCLASFVMVVAIVSVVGLVCVAGYMLMR